MRPGEVSSGNFSGCRRAGRGPPFERWSSCHQALSPYLLRCAMPRRRLGGRRWRSQRVTERTPLGRGRCCPTSAQHGYVGAVIGRPRGSRPCAPRRSMTYVQGGTRRRVPLRVRHLRPAAAFGVATLAGDGKVGPVASCNTLTSLAMDQVPPRTNLLVRGLFGGQLSSANDTYGDLNVWFIVGVPEDAGHLITDAPRSGHALAFFPSSQ